MKQEERIARIVMELEALRQDLAEGENETLNEIMEAYIIAGYIFLTEVSDFDGDALEFTHAMNRLAVGMLLEGANKDA